MCGVAGFVDLRLRSGPDELWAMATGMAGSLSHRGPDDQGVWIDAEAGVALGHTRLAIIDLSSAGAQPMISSCGRFVLSYNGEVYNAPELRAELQAAGRPFRGHSDTEVIVEGFGLWGVRETVERMIGMFAFAAWDRLTRKLTLVRDRLGIKPLYWGRLNGRLVFGSELKALTALGGWQREIDLEALAAFLTRGCIPAPKSIYRGVSKLSPGTLLEYGAEDELTINTYWSLAQVSEEGQASPFDVSDQEAIEILESLLADAVRRCMVADVPLGMFLSGGIDSSIVAALMQMASPLPVHTFSIGFHEQKYDEARHAKQVAAHLGTDHTEFYVTPAELQAVIPKLPQIYDEPFADSSQVPTYLVSEIARRHVTVALSGDGGDEIFAGYNHYRKAEQARHLPRPLRAMLSAVPPAVWDHTFAILPRRMRLGKMGRNMRKKLTEILPRDMFYQGIVKQWADAGSLVRGANASDENHSISQMRGRFRDEVTWMQYLDTITYLPDDVLTKVDRASMAVALEVRVPLLDHRVVELSWKLPRRFKMRGRTSKWLLRQVAYKYVPKALLERPKMGFGLPILSQWLRGPLKAWAGDLLNPSAINRAGLLDPAPIAEKWTEHQSGVRKWHQFLWTVLMFQAWCRENGIG